MKEHSGFTTHKHTGQASNALDLFLLQKLFALKKKNKLQNKQTKLYKKKNTKTTLPPIMF